MKKTTLWLLAGALLLTVACTNQVQEDQNLAQLKELSNEVKANYAPDRRVKIFEMNFTADSTQKGVYIVKGATTEPEARQALLDAAAKNNIQLLDSILTLPAAALGDKTYGITDQSVINFRYGTAYSTESATQTVMGTPLRILEKKNGWTRAMTPEGYIAWVSDGITGMNKEEYDAWTKAEKMIITTHYTLFRAQANANAAVVSDGVWGNIVRFDGESGGFYKVILPKGHTAFVPKHDAQKFNTWLSSRNPTAENIIATGKQFMGFPYMWGGTSAKAMDCSGFTKTCFYLNGVIIQRDASQQAYTGESVDISKGLENLQAGDLLFFGRKATETAKERITHVGIYMKDGEFIHEAGHVHINSLLPDAKNYYPGSTRLVRVQRLLTKIDQDKDIVSIKNHPWYQ